MGKTVMCNRVFLYRKKCHFVSKCHRQYCSSVLRLYAINSNPPILWNLISMNLWSWWTIHKHPWLLCYRGGCGLNTSKRSLIFFLVYIHIESPDFKIEQSWEIRFFGSVVAHPCNESTQRVLKISRLSGNSEECEKKTTIRRDYV